MASSGMPSFSEMHLEVKEIIACGEKFVARSTNSGTHTVPLMGVSATGRHIPWLGIAIYTARNGKIVEGWFGEAMLGALLQLVVVDLATA